MIIDIKYHVASLVAVFLALALGIIVGTSLLSGQSVLEKQQELVDSLRVDFDKLKADNDLLKAEVVRIENQNIADDNFIKKLMPTLLTGRLAGGNFLVIRTNSAEDLTEMTDVLALAGGITEMVITFKEDFPQVLQAHHEKYASTFSLNWKGNDDDTEAVVKILASELMQMDNEHLYASLNQLQNDGAISFSGKLTKLPTGIIIVGGADDKANNFQNIDSPLIDGLTAHNIRVVGVESYGTAFSYIPGFRKKGISTVDNIDSNLGLISMVGVAQGMNGNFGLKGTSSALIPSEVEAWLRP